MRPGKRKKEPSSPSAAAAAAEAAVFGNDYLLREILVHLDHPTCLVHAALVSRRWLRLASDPAFLRRFRGLHPPRLLGLCVRGIRSDARFVPLPHPRELDVVFRRARFEELKGSVLDCRNGRVLMCLSEMGQVTSSYVLCSPLHQTPEFRMDIPSRYGGHFHFIPEDGGNSMWYIAVDLVLSCARTKISLRQVVMQAGARSEVGVSTAIEPPSRWMCHMHCTLLLNNKCYILGNAGYILEFDLASMRLCVINLPDGVQQHDCRKNIELSPADGSGIYLIHLKGSQIHVWHHDADGDNVGEWQLVDTICARQTIGHLAKPNWESILESWDPYVAVHRVGDNAEFLLQVGCEVFHMQIKTRKVEKVFEMAEADPKFFVHPFMMVWPPSFPALRDEQVERGQDECPSNSKMDKLDTGRQSKLQPLNFEIQETSAHLSMEKELDSTASMPPSPMGEHSDLPSTVVRTEHQARVTKLLGANRRGSSSEVDKQFDSTTIRSSPVKVTKRLKIKRRQGSRASLEVWDHFTPQESDNGPVAVCNHCQQVYKCDRATHGTSTLRKHLTDLCKLSPFWDPGKRRKLACGNSTPKDHLSIEDCRRALAKMVIIDEMPFSIVEGEGFREYSRTLEPRFELPSRITVARDCLKIYMEEKARLKKSMNGHRICLTTDTWTSIQNLCYLSLTAQWIDHEWKLHKRILNFCLVPDHKGERIGEKIEECLLDWGIGNIFTITVDNASSNDSAISYLKTISKDWEGIILKNEFLHIRCCAHIVNLIVKSGLKCIDTSITKIRNAVRYVRSSPEISDQFKRCVDMEKITDKSLISLDVDTRWNATYLMLRSAVKFEKAFARLAKDNKNYLSHIGESGLPNALDWEQARKFIGILKPFSVATVRLSGSLYVTSSTFFHDFLLIHDMLVQLAEKDGWDDMALRMKQKFDKYWGNVAVLNPLLFMAVALDPRFKLKYLDFCAKIIYNKVKAQEFISTIEGGLTRLFDWYVQDASVSTIGATNCPHFPFIINFEDIRDDPSRLLATQFAVHLEEIESRESNSELSRFLKDNCEKQTDKFDILNWWKVNSSKYPILSKLAKAVLAVPVSTVASESAFSTGGRVISSFRSSLSPKMVEALICAQSWMRSSPKDLDIEEIIKDLQNCEELEEDK